MNTSLALLTLLAAATLEVGGDAIVRSGLNSHGELRRAVLIAIGGLVLIAYGVVVNLPRWDFGRLLGVYVCFFVVVAQVIAYFGFHQKPSAPILIGSTLIVAGGMVMTLWKG